MGLHDTIVAWVHAIIAGTHMMIMSHSTLMNVKRPLGENL